MTKATILALGICFMSVAGLLRAEDDGVIIMRQPNDYVKVKLECVGGYFFAVAAIGGQMNAGRGVAIVQVMTVGRDVGKPPQPVLCK